MKYLNVHVAMKVVHYMKLTGLSHTVTAKELSEFEHDGIRLHLHLPPCRQGACKVHVRA
ncbi:MAG: hypothetical protein U0I09_00985 [Bacteroidaceae bacterium]|nr:hypothetical protein [Bacteroidaceae bacterium]